MIVGAGIAGLTLANALERRGFRPSLVDLASTLQPRGVGLAIMPNGMRALERIGLASRISKTGSHLERAVTLSPNGVELGPSNSGVSPSGSVRRSAFTAAV